MATKSLPLNAYYTNEQTAREAVEKEAREHRWMEEPKAYGCGTRGTRNKMYFQLRPSVGYATDCTYGYARVVFDGDVYLSRTANIVSVRLTEAS